MVLVALAVTFLGSALLYLSAPSQSWLARPLPVRWARAGGVMGLIAALILWQSMTTPVTGLLICLTLLMALLPSFPYLALARRRTKG